MLTKLRNPYCFCNGVAKLHKGEMEPHRLTHHNKSEKNVFGVQVGIDGSVALNIIGVYFYSHIACSY